MGVILVGVLHGKRLRGACVDLLNDECKTGFMEKISPCLNANSLLVIEGGWTKLLTPGSLYYWLKHMLAMSELGSFRRGPALTWRDPRSRLFSGDQTALNVITLFSSIYESITWDFAALDAISSIEELSERARSRTLPLSMNRKLTDEECKCMRALSYSFRKFDDAMFSAASAWTKGDVYIITGAVHTMTLHLRTGLPTMCLANWKKKETLQGVALAALTGISLPLKHGCW